MNRLLPSRRASMRTSRLSRSGSARRCRAPAKLCTAGRGWSVGSMSAGRPCSRRRHHVTESAMATGVARSRCQTAKSAYCTGSGASGEGRLAVKASYSAASSGSSTR